MTRSQKPMDHLPADVQAAYARVARLSRLMDSVVGIPGTNVRFGFDALVGLVPILGDLISQAISTYLIWEARQLGASGLTIARMIGNSLIDTTIGAIPVAGDAFDIAFRANMKNLRLLQKHLERTHGMPSGDGRTIEVDYERAA